jgi:thiamine biosynthesis protein ThiS
MEIILNGEPRQVPQPITLQDLLRLLELKEDRVAIELNRGIVQRNRWPETLLRDQDRLEVVQFVGGG